MGDTPYSLVLGELGLAGFFVFLWMIYRVFSTAGMVYRAYKEPWIKALSLGLMTSIVGLLFQALGVNNFIIVRIMEPFWFLTALVMILSRDASEAGAQINSSAGMNL
jgi:CDP-diglyceride synthetase